MLRAGCSSSNVIGIAVAVVLVRVLRCCSSSAGVEVNVALPAGFAGDRSSDVVIAIVWAVTSVALAFGLMFTPLGRRLRAEFS